MFNPISQTHRHRSMASLHRIRRRTLVASILIALPIAHSAHAQQQAQAAQDPGKVVDLGTVTVTAQGRKENILAVPYNISAVSGEKIEQAGILDNAELLRSVPGIGVIDSGARNSSVVNGIRIRGLNVDSSALGDYAVAAASTVATYVDNTPLFANFLLSDIDRVEVLRGPQGTLYGSGALGGAVRYILRKPELDGFNGRASLTASSVDHSDGIGGSGSVTLNVPLAETWALRVNGTLNHYPGVTDYRNVYVLDGKGTPAAPDGVLASTAQYRDVKDADFVHQKYGRAALLWKPNDTVDFTLSYMAQADRMGGRRGTSLGNDGWGKPYGDLEVGSVQLEPADRHVHLTSLEANIDLGFATLTSSSSDYNHAGDIVSENTGFYAQNGWLGAFYYNYPRPMASAVRDYGDRAFVQEFRLVSKQGGKLDYVVGFYYQNEQRRSSQDSYLRGFKQWWDAAYPGAKDAVVNDNDFQYRQHDRQKETALYGELTWHATDTLQATFGMRAFRDEMKTTVDQVTGLYSSIIDGSHSQNKRDDDRTLFKGNVSWSFQPDNQLYATISEGYRRGGTNGTPTTGPFKESPAWQDYEADTVTNYELGIKGRQGSLTYNADVFYDDWKHPQINSSTTNWGFFAVQNAPKASSKGVELELSGQVGTAFTYGLGYTYTDATLSSDARAVDGAYLIGHNGDQLPGVARNRFNANASYTWQVGAGWLTLRGDAYHQSESQNALSLSPKFRYTLPDFSIFNLSATYSLNNWDTTLWLKNLTNTDAVTGIYTPLYMGTSPAQNYYGNGSKALVTLPRTIGVTVSYRF
ncbi:TonB-dependent receptor [Rudaea sp.]|uniref:TonB-dependent receptor n=1 Tax=Rudaea sp. TaxID=2136325 RepID=UPI003783C5DE